MKPKLTIITPTFKRSHFVNRMARYLMSQSYQNWQWIVVHDGPIKNEHRWKLPNDNRIKMIVMDRHVGDYGASPRLVGAEEALKNGSDYLLFWDDDNFYFPKALEQIKAAIFRNKSPDYLLTSILFRGGVLPPLDKKAENLQEGELDTANLVIKTRLGRDAYRHIVSHGIQRATDYAVYRYLTTLRNLRGGIIREPLILYDGNRRLRYLLWKLGVKSDPTYWFSYRRIYYGLKAMNPRTQLQPGTISDNWRLESE